MERKNSRARPAGQMRTSPPTWLVATTKLSVLRPVAFAVCGWRGTVCS
jgi:hypothetical protein